ncbi:FimV/HubP family polar landmark protein [Endozoicomonas lisbonensis]
MAMTGALGSGLANALGLGEVTMHSSLNQPLDAEIELLQLRDLTRNEILPNLASRSDFQRAGIGRPFSLSSLSFKTRIREDGTGYIHVTSADAVREPFLNFLMEVHWPSGRLLREYTLLLDPPSFSEQPAQPVRPPTTRPYAARPPIQQPDPYVEPHNRRTDDYLPAPERALQPEIRPITERPFGSARQTTQDDTTTGSTVRSYKVQPNDNLWSIARAVRPSGELSVQQTMVAIQRNNPNAFMRENINELKKGQVLRIPTQDDILSMSYQESVAEVAKQNREWQARLEQLDASRRSKADTAGDGTVADGRLTIVGSDNAAGTGQDQGGGSGSADTGALKNDLSITQEKMDELSRENDELRSRLKDLDEQIATLKRLITLKDDQMAALQSSGNEPEAKPKPKPKPAQESKPMVPPKEEGGLLFWILGALVPVGLAGAFLVYRRRKKAQDEDDFDIDGDGSEAMPLMGEDLLADDEELQLDETLEIDEEALSDREFEGEPEETVQQTQDALSEADIYIAYGRFPQAAELLGKSITAGPERTDLRLKLLEVHAEANDLDSFKAALAELEALGNEDANRQADVFKARFPTDAFMQEGGEPVVNDLSDVDLSEEADSEQEFDLGELDDEDGLEAEEPGDDLEFDFSEDDEGDEELPDLDLEDLDLIDEPDAEGSNDQGDADLDDLDLGFDPDSDSDSDFDSDHEEESAGDSAISDSMSDFEAALDDDDDLDFLSDEDEVSTKLDLARAYMDMGDQEGAREILQEVLDSGNDEQKEEAQTLIQGLDG